MDDDQGETEIMYPSAPSVSALRRKSTVKVLNCEKPQANSADTKLTHKSNDHLESIAGSPAANSREHLVPAVSESQTSAVKLVEKGKSATRRRTSSRSDPTISTPSQNTQEGKSADPSSDSKVDTQQTELLIVPISVSQTLATTSLDKSVSMDTGLSRSTGYNNLVDQSALSMHNIDQSPKTLGKDKVDDVLAREDQPPPVAGSSTLPRPSRASEKHDMSMSHSASLPRPKDRYRAKRSSNPKSSSVSMLQVDESVRER